MAVHAAISLGLDFSPGHAFARKVWGASHQTVHPTKDSGHFCMVVSFGRSTFRLDEENVALALEAAIGGYCNDLLVSGLHDRVFSFNVSSKDVCFMILAKRFYSCPHFKCYFHLWGFGGPNWAREYILWQKEFAGEWILMNCRRPVSPRRLSIRRRRAALIPVRPVIAEASTVLVEPNIMPIQFGSFDPISVELVAPIPRSPPMIQAPVQNFNSSRDVSVGPAPGQIIECLVGPSDSGPR